MLISILLLVPIVAGGLSLTYLFDDDAPLMWRAAAGLVVGSAIYGTLTFLLACFIGLGLAAPLGLLLVVSPVLLFRDKRRLDKLKIDKQRATNKLQGGSWAKLLRFAFYAFFFVLFCLFFSQAMYQTPLGIYTGGSQNLGDLPFHLGAIFSFTDGANFPPANPSFAGAKFSYPFIADLASAAFVKLGADVQSAMFVQDVAWAFALLIILERFVFKLTADRLAGKIAPWLLFFSGGLGFLWFFSDYWHQGKGLADFLGSLPKDCTISDDFRWGNSLVTLFMTQRSLLLGMPLTIVVLQWLWDFFDSKREDARTANDQTDAIRGRVVIAFLIGLLAGTLPLVHLHSLITLFVVSIFLLGLNPENWRIWTAFGAGVSLIAIPELAWSIAGSASHASQFIDWNYGWDKGESNVFWFWFKNTGLFIPSVAGGTFLSYKTSDKPAGSRLREFASPFLLLFIICNALKLAPWPWDNIKVLIYCFIGGLPFASMALSRLWRHGKYTAAVAAIVFVTLIFSGSLDVWRTVTGQTKYLVFNQDSIRIAQIIDEKTAPNALFLNAATYNTAVVLTGRRSLMRYTGNLYSYGIDYGERESDLKKIYQGGPQSDALLAKYGIDYVLISQEESQLAPNQSYFSKFPVIAEAGSARVYKVR